MARELDSVQAERAGRSHIAPVALVKLTTYTNRISATVDKVFYLSDTACEYDYGSTGTDQMFLPAIVGGSDFFSGFGHVTAPDDQTSFSQEFNLHLDNSLPFNGSRMAALLQGHNLEGASIEVAQLFVDRIDSLPLDLTAYDGDEHTVLFRGRVRRVAPITSEVVTVQCSTELPSMAGSWIYASDDTKVDPQDLGKRLPRVYGEAKRVPLVNYEVGWETTFVDALDASETGSGYKITDGSGLPTGSFNIRVDGEEITCSNASATTLQIDTRGVGSTTGAAHDAGALFSELVSTATYIASDRESNALNELYVINPINGVLMRLDSSQTQWTTNTSDTTTISGETVTSVKFTAEQLSTLMEYFKAHAEAAGDITTQPDFTIDDPQTILIDMIAREERDIGTAGDPMTNPTNMGGVRRLDGNGAGADTYIVGWYPSSSISSSGRIIRRWRPRLEGNVKNTHTGGTDDIFIYASFRNFDDSSLGGDAVEAIYTTADENTETYGLVAVGSWHTPSGSVALSAFESTGYSSGKWIVLYGAVYATEDFNTNEWCEWSFAGVEVELEPSDLTRSVDVASSTFSVGFGLRFFADITGVAGAYSELAQAFDSGTWETQSCAVAYDASTKQEGTNSLKVTIDFATLGSASGISTEALTNWTGNNATLALDSGQGHREGSNAIEGSADSTADAEVAYLDTGLNLDFTIGADSTRLVILADVRFDKNGSTGFVRVKLGTDASNYWYVDYQHSQFADDAWNTIAMGRTGGEIGTVTESNIDFFAIEWNRISGGASGSIMYVDNIRKYSWPHVVQNNDIAAALSYESSAPNYRLDIRQDTEPTDALFDSVATDTDFFVTDEVETGTTKPATYREIPFTPAMADETWEEVESDTVSDTGTPDLTDVQTVRVEMRYPLINDVFDRDEVITIWLDNFRRDTVTYDDHPAGILVHHIAEIGGESFDEDSYDALVTSLGASAKWGFDARSLGFTWEEVLQRMAFEARCNIVPVETSAGRVWKMLAADSEYGFGAPASSAVITQTHNMTDVGRSVDDIASYFSFRYAFDASLPGGGNEEGFRLALDANPSVSDVPITTTLITNAAQRFGAVDSAPVAFRCIQDTATAQDVAGYIVQERMANDRRVFELRDVAWFDALPYDVGDIVSITAPWASSATTCRITSMSKAFRSNAWTITAVEVLETGTRTP